MTLQEILRSKSKCGGCKNQDKAIYPQECFNCSTRNDFGQTIVNDLVDHYELDESLKAIEEKAANWDVIEWAADKNIQFKFTGKITLEHIKTMRERWEREANECNKK